MIPFLDALLAKPLVAMGPVGTNFHRQGLMQLGENTSLWCLHNRHYFQNALKLWVELGCDIIHPNSSEANALILEKSKAGLSSEEICARLVSYAREVAENQCYIGGDMQTLTLSTGRFLVPYGILEHERIYDSYRRQAEALYRAGVDFFWLFTMVDLKEVQLAVQAVRDTCALPVVVTMAFDRTRHRGYRTLMGVEAAEAARLMQGLQVDVFGTNCGSLNMHETSGVLRVLREEYRGFLAVSPNAGLPKVIEGETVYSIGPGEMAESVPEWLDCGASIISGCCGATPEHIQALIEKLQEA